MRKKKREVGRVSGFRGTCIKHGEKQLKHSDVLIKNCALRAKSYSKVKLVKMQIP